MAVVAGRGRAYYPHDIVLFALFAARAPPLVSPLASKKFELALAAGLVAVGFAAGFAVAVLVRFRTTVRKRRKFWLLLAYVYGVVVPLAAVPLPH